jgi:hypothetical protein
MASGGPSLQEKVKHLQDFLSKHKGGLGVFGDAEQEALARAGFYTPERIALADEAALSATGLEMFQVMFLQGCLKSREPPRRKSLVWDEVRGRVESVLEQHKESLDACLADKLLEQLPVFQVKDSHPSAKSIRAARLLVYDGVPAFLLHNLPTCEEERSPSTLRLAQELEREFDAFSPGAVQGAGKTRQVFEHASLHFSPYFIGGNAQNNPGSADMRECVLHLSSLIGPDLEVNHRLAEKQLLALVVARLIILDHLLRKA